MSRTILVTGGGTGIGLAIATRFAAAGDTVIITGRRPDVLKQAVSQLANSDSDHDNDSGTVTAATTAIECDATDPAQLTVALDQLPPSLDVLVNNAGGNTDFAQSEPQGLADIATAWRANLDANLLSAVLTTEALADRINAGGAVLHLGSIAAERAGSGSYGAAKAALAAWNLDLAARLGPRDITANVLSCGYIADTEFFHGRLSERRRETLIGQTATHRAGAPQDVADTAYFLASPGARHITAQTIHVNGGAHVTR